MKNLKKINFRKELASFNFVDKYAHDNGERKETWDESIDRIYDMHRVHLKKKGIDTSIITEDMINAEKNKIFLSSQRARQWATSDENRGILQKNEKLYNCCGSYADRIDYFGEFIYLLLCGCGVGSNICYKHVDKLPVVLPVSETTDKFYVEDTIEGWGDLVKYVMRSYLETGSIGEIDYSKIRAKGSLIAGRFLHSGSEPLELAIKNVRKVLSARTSLKLRPIDVFDIGCYLAQCVLSGGVRRSATIFMFSSNDEEMMNAKIGNWYNENPQRAMANISPILVRKNTTLDNVKRVVKSARAYGEPGILFADNEDFVTNPCLPAWAKVLTHDGIKNLIDIKIGDKIWSKEGWTTVINFMDNGVKDVHKYETSHGNFYSTENHRVVTREWKKEIKDAKEIEALDCNISSPFIVNNSKFVTITNSSYYSTENVYDITVDNSSHTFWCDGFNISNCGEIGLYPKNEKGESGWQFCNLVEVNLSKVKSDKELYDACKFASCVATIQASYNEFKYLGKVSEEITKRDSLIGVSLTGYMDAGFKIKEKFLGWAAFMCSIKNRVISKELHINASTRCTTMKPSGNASILLETEPACNPAHSKYYLRHIRITRDKGMYKFIKNNCPELIVCDNEVIGDYTTGSAVIAFPIESKGKKFKDNYSFKDNLNRVVKLYKNWVLKSENNNNKNVHHNISNTLVVKDNEWDSVPQLLFDNMNNIGGISLLSSFGDKVYQYAPMTSVDESMKKLSDCYVDEYLDLYAQSKKFGWDFINQCKFFDEKKREEFINAFYYDKYKEICDNYTSVDWMLFSNNKEYENIGNMAATACAGGNCTIL